MTVRIGLLIGGTLLFWLAAWGVGVLLNLGSPDVVLPYSAAAMALCLVPAVGTFVLAESLARSQPQVVGVAFLAGTMIRMAVVLGLAMLLFQVEFFRRQDGWFAWVAVFYLFVLALETALVVVGRASEEKPPAA